MYLNDRTKAAFTVSWKGCHLLYVKKIDDLLCNMLQSLFSKDKKKRKFFVYNAVDYLF